MALREFAVGPLKGDIARFLAGPTLFDPRDQAAEATAVHDDALALLARLHDLPMHDAAERARLYREDLLGSPAYRRLKDAMDLWCASWFWPAAELAHAPLLSTLARPSDATRTAAKPAVTLLGKNLPVIWRHAPVLSRCAERVGRHANRSIEVELLLLGPHVCAVQVDHEGKIPEERNAVRLCGFTCLFPL